MRDEFKGKNLRHSVGVLPFVCKVVGTEVVTLAKSASNKILVRAQHEASHKSVI